MGRRIFRAKEGISVSVGGVPFTVREGQTVREGHPILEGHETSFEPLDRADFEHDAPAQVEQATAAPGERRAR